MSVRKRRNFWPGVIAVVLTAILVGVNQASAETPPTGGVLVVTIIVCALLACAFIALATWIFGKLNRPVADPPPPRPAWEPPVEPPPVEEPLTYGERYAIIRAGPSHPRYEQMTNELQARCAEGKTLSRTEWKALDEGIAARRARDEKSLEDFKIVSDEALE